MGKSALLTDELREQLKTIFSKLNQEVRMIAILNPEEEKSKELSDLLEDFAETSPLLALEIYEKGQSKDWEEKLDAKYLPLVALFDKNQTYTGICFHGVPGGKELNSFVAAISNCGGAILAPDKYLKRSIDSIKKPRNIKVFVSLACHHCPHVVAACNKIALLNPNVETHMYDANLYPDLVEEYKIERVPMMVINENNAYYGKKSIEEIANLLNMIKN